MFAIVCIGSASQTQVSQTQVWSAYTARDRDGIGTGKEVHVVLTRLTPSTLNKDCYRVLKEAILNLDLVPGTQITESAIAAQLGISKTPVREALARLASEGFVVSGPGRRSFIAGLSVDALREIYQVRAILETASVRQVTPILTDSDLAELESAIKRAFQGLEREDLSAFLDANEHFHTHLINCSRNQCLIDIAMRLFDHVRRVRSALYCSEQMVHDHDLSRKGIENHQRILAALIKRDDERAAREMAIDVQTFVDLMDTPTVQEALLALTGRTTLHHLQRGQSVTSRAADD